MKGIQRQRSIVLLIAAALTAAATMQAQLPTRADIETALQRTFGYDPSVTWTIYDIRPSPIPGVADVLFSISKNQPQHLYVSLPARLAIVGQSIPFGPDPYVDVRASLRAAAGPARGADNPVITMVVFTDLECPHCKAADPVLARLQGDFPQIRTIVQPYPLPASLHPWALKAAEYADCVAKQSSAAFWKFQDALFEKQSDITEANVDQALSQAAAASGADADKAAACSALPDTKAHIDQSVALGQSLDVTEVPTVFLNGRRVLGIADIPYDGLKRLLQFEIEHANR